MLVQATAAHQIADVYVSEPGVEILGSDHPRSGARAEPDELLGIYAGDECALPPLDGFAQYLAAARPIYREFLIRAGLEPGFCTDDTDLFNIAGMDIAISPTDASLSPSTGPSWDASAWREISWFSALTALGGIHSPGLRNLVCNTRPDPAVASGQRTAHPAG